MAKVIFNMAKVMVSLNIDSNVRDLTRPGLRPGELTVVALVSFFDLRRQAKVALRRMCFRV